jgi:hypothetical protein
MDCAQRTASGAKQPGGLMKSTDWIKGIAVGIEPEKDKSGQSRHHPDEQKLNCGATLVQVRFGGEDWRARDWFYH